MTTADITPDVALPDSTELTHTSGWRATKNIIATGLIWLCVGLAFIPLVLILIYVATRGASQISWSMLTETIPPVTADGPGIGPAIYGTLIITVAATVMAVPLGILAAIYLNEYGKSGIFAQITRFLSYVMTGVPSIVMGLFIFAIWVIEFGSSAFAGALAIGALMLPVVIRSTEEMLNLVPNYLREGSYALGGRKWKTIITVVLPAALPGITSGTLLAIARGAGETAPLLFTILATREFNYSLFSDPNTSLPSQIFANASSPFVGAQDRAYAAAFVLVVLAHYVLARALLLFGFSSGTLLYYPSVIVVPYLTFPRRHRYAAHGFAALGTALAAGLGLDLSQELSGWLEGAGSVYGGAHVSVSQLRLGCDIRLNRRDSIVFLMRRYMVLRGRDWPDPATHRVALFYDVYVPDSGDAGTASDSPSR